MERLSTQSHPATTRTARLVKRGRAALIGLIATAVIAAGLSATPQLSTPASAAPVGTDFAVTLPDLTFILEQIKIAEHHVGPTFDPLSPCSNIIGPGPDQIPEGANADQLPFGLRTLNGICNNLVPGRELFGATYQPFIRLMEPEYRAAEPAPPLGPGVVQPSSYDPTFENLNGYVNDSQPRIISNLIADQTAGNPAANAAAGGPGLTGGPALPTCLSLATVPPTPLTDLPPCEPEAGESYYIENVAPDLGIARPFSTAFTFFGQFFDHGLDLTTKAGEPVFMPLQADDPLILEGAVPPGLEFMVLSRATQTGPDAEVPVNQASPYVDQNQTYTSDPSQQVFQREYVNSPPVDTGRLLGGNPAVGAPGTGLTTWADVKDQAATLLGFRLLDTDVLDVPMMAADLYGNFIPGPSGFPQMITKGPDGLAGTIDDVLLEGIPGVGIPTPLDVVRSGHGWLVDIAHHAVPGEGRVPDAGDTVSGSVPCTAGTPGSQIEGFCDDLLPNTYDNELLDAHFICGDGRCNENIALSSVHHVFHSEHNRLVAQIKDTLTLEAGTDFLNEWKLTPGGDWNGRRLFQAAKFATEMQYQHLAFEEFARRVQPAVDAFAGYDTTIDAGIMAEFAHAVYRFGHTMLTEEIMRRDAGTSAGERHPVGLIDGFLNPPEFFEGVDGTDFAKTPDEAAGGILRGLASENGQEIDEFVVEALRNNLLGLPLDLVSINLARGRDTGIPRLNSFRQNIFDLTGDALYRPYSSWFDYGFALGNPESLVNYIAAYGTAASVASAPTLAARRAEATILMDDVDFMNGTGAWTGVNTGVDDMDLWIGSIGEAEEFFGGLLGPTANFIFELQMENLQNGDRLYYLHRLEGIPMLNSLEGNSLSELIERNTTAIQLAADVFATPTFTFDLDIVHPDCTGLVDDPATSYDETEVLVLMADCTVRLPILEPGAFSGRTGAAGTADDMILGGTDDDSIRGLQGNDRIDADEGNDVVLGGLGDDITYGNQGVDNLKGGPGNDAISGGTGEDLIQGGTGDDFMMINADPGEVFGGTGDDIVIGGTSFDTIFGSGGDDWLVGGGQADLVQGDDGAPFQNNPAGSDGHDVLDGGPGNDDHDAEGGDDIMLAGEGTERFEGMDGFDWVTHKDDPQPADSDLTRRGLIDPAVDTLRDRFDFVEGLSGWDGDDILRGDDIDLLPVGNPFRGVDVDVLTTDGINRIDGLADLLPDGATLPFSAGNIMLGGAGSDLLEGRGQDDIIDGDAWLNVQLQAPNPAGGTLLVDSPSELVAMVFSGAINPGDIDIVRSIEPGTPGGDIDIAEFDGPLSDYDITPLDTTAGQTKYTVNHVSGLGGGGNCSDVTSLCDDGMDTLFNIEFLRFSDVDFNISGGAFPDVAVPPRPPAIAPSAPLAVEATVADSASIVSWVEPGSDGGDPNITFDVLGSDGSTCTAVAPDTECEVTGLTNGVPVTFTVTATNSAGTSPASDPSAPVIPAAPPGPPTSVVAVASDTLATLTWLAPADDGSTPILTYTVTGSPAGSCTVVASSLGCVVAGLTNGILHSFTVTATNSAGTGPASAPSNTVTPTAPPVIPPPPPDPDPELQALVDCNSPLTHPFEDVPADSFANDDIACIFNLGITTGTSTTTFEPRRDLTREQMASFLARFYRVVTGLPCDSTPSPFTDVAADSFAIDDISCLFNLGVTTGTSDTTFEPDRDVPREEMAAFLARMYIVIAGTACSGGATPFTDIAASPFEDEIGCIYNLGITTGTAPDSFEPRRDVTREQTASFLARLYKLLTA